MKPSQAYIVMKQYYLANQPFLIKGSPGVGKSDMVHQLGDEFKCPVIDMRLSQMDAVDLRGIPYRHNSMTHWAVNSQLPTDEKVHGPVGILFLDELTAAPKALQAPAYQIVLDHRIGEVPLLPGWRVAAAGNNMMDRAIVESMSTALKNRFGHIPVETDYEDWCRWAITHADVSLELLGFIKFRPKLLNDFEEFLKRENKSRKDKGQMDQMAFATPRSWMFVDRMLKQGVSKDIELDVYSGLVGAGCAAEFLAYIKHYRNLPDLDEVIKNPATAPVPDEPAQLYAISVGLAARATPENFDKVIKYLMRIAPEFQVLAVKDAVLRNDDISSTKAFNIWAGANADVMI